MWARSAVPLGTVVWSNPGDGSGVTSIVPAVPSATGVADVFAFQADGTVQAITSDGATAWTADVSRDWALPDFQGGLVAMEDSGSAGFTIVKVDGRSGQKSTVYSPVGNSEIHASNDMMVVHPDGTVFTVLQNWTSDYHVLPDSVVGINSATGANFNVPLPAMWTIEFGMIVAGDGYAYIPYAWRDEEGESETDHVRLFRVNSSGGSDDIFVGDFTAGGDCGDTICVRSIGMISNADQGVVLTFAAVDGGHMAVTTGTSASVVSAPVIGNNSAAAPVLQAQDGSFVGTAWTNGAANMVGFDASGNIRYVVPNEQPQIATADGGVIGQSGITYDANGNATEMIPNMPTYSWLGYAYRDGVVDQLVASALASALTFAAFQGGNLGHTGTAVKLVRSTWFLPEEINKTASVNAFFYQTVRANMAPTKIALELLVKQRATAAAFKKALDVPNMVVAYFGHGLYFTGDSGASGLCFGGTTPKRCLVPIALNPIKGLPAGTTEAVLADGTRMEFIENGFTPKAKIVILAACDIDTRFTNQWHGQQALIVPVYSDENEEHDMNLTNAAWEVQSMLLTLETEDVNAAVAAGNHTAIVQGSLHSWKVIPPEAGNVKIR